MYNIPYVSIRSVMFDLSLMIDEQYWDENKMLEWAIKGFRKMSIPSKFQLKNVVTTVIEHTAKIPKNTKYIVQVAYKENITNQDIEYFQEIMGLTDSDPGITAHMFDPEGLPTNAIEAMYAKYYNVWKPMKPSTSSFIKSVKCQYTVPASLAPETTNPVTSPQILPYNLVNCQHEYNVDVDCTLTTTMKNGLIYISYMSYPKDVNGDTLIPDDENLKDALYHWCMYRYWETKGPRHEEASMRERQWHLSRYQTLAAKATGNLNMPDTGQMEVLFNINSRMIKSSKDFDNLFTSLGNHQYNNHL